MQISKIRTKPSLRLVKWHKIGSEKKFARLGYAHNKVDHSTMWVEDFDSGLMFKVLYKNLRFSEKM